MNDAARPSLEARMERAVEAMERDFATVRTGRAATSLVERIQVEYYGTMTPLNQLASISIPEPHQVVIQPWDRGVLGAIDKPVREVINRAASLLQTPLSLLALVVTYEVVAGFFCGEATEHHAAWRQDAALSARRHVVWLDQPFDSVLTVMPAM